MNKKLVVLIAGAVVVCLVIVVPTRFRSQNDSSDSRHIAPVVAEPVPVAPEPRAIDIPEDAIRFDLSYRGLSFEKGTMQYNFSYGYGLGDYQENSFLKAVRKHAVDDIKIVYFSGFTAQTYSALEYKNTDACKFYFDSNGDGKLADDEIFDPINVTESSSTKRCDFITSDFVATNQKGRRYRFRARLGVGFYGAQAEPQCMWSPACVMEGNGQFNGKDMKFVLRLGNMDGRFVHWGRSQFSLVPPDADTGSMSRSQLSSLIFKDGKFYQLRFQGSGEASEKLTVVLVEDHTPTGTLAVHLEGKEDINAAVSYATVSGADDKTIRFRIDDSQEFPADKYVLSSGQFSYGATGEHDRSADFMEGPTYEIVAGNTSTLAMGHCELTISSIDESRRYHRDVKERDEFDDDMNVYLSFKVRGAGGEMFTRFKKRDEKGRYREVKAHMTIIDAKGKTIESKELEYG